MVQVNEDYRKLRAGYLFPEIGRRVRSFAQANPDARIIRLGIGDVTLPLAPAIVAAMHAAVDEQAAQAFGYGPEHGYDFLIDGILKADFAARGVDLDADEIFVSDGSKQDSANIQEIFGRDCSVLVTDPSYPVYVDTNVMAGRSGDCDERGMYAGIHYLAATEENGFAPGPPSVRCDLAYLCSPNNPTGAVADVSGMFVSRGAILLVIFVGIATRTWAEEPQDKSASMGRIGFAEIIGQVEDWQQSDLIKTPWNLNRDKGGYGKHFRGFDRRRNFTFKIKADKDADLHTLEVKDEDRKPFAISAGKTYTIVNRPVTTWNYFQCSFSVSELAVDWGKRPTIRLIVSAEENYSTFRPNKDEHPTAVCAYLIQVRPEGKERRSVTCCDEAVDATSTKQYASQ